MKVSTDDLISRISNENFRIKISFDLFKKKIEESNNLLKKKKDGMIKASEIFMSSTVYADSDASHN